MALVEPVFLLFALIACLLYRSASRNDTLRPYVLVALLAVFLLHLEPLVLPAHHRHGAAGLQHVMAAGADAVRADAQRC